MLVKEVSGCSLIGYFRLEPLLIIYIVYSILSVFRIINANNPFSFVFVATVYLKFLFLFGLLFTDSVPSVLLIRGNNAFNKLTPHNDRRLRFLNFSKITYYILDSIYINFHSFQFIICIKGSKKLMRLD